MNAKKLYDEASSADSSGDEEKALGLYESALKGIDSLSLDDQKGLLLGLGSTYRWCSRLEDSARTLNEAKRKFPNSPEFSVFLSLTQLDQGQSKLAVANLLETLLNESKSPSFLQYKRALLQQIEMLRTS